MLVSHYSDAPDHAHRKDEETRLEVEIIFDTGESIIGAFIGTHDEVDDRAKSLIQRLKRESVDRIVTAVIASFK